MFVLRDPSLSTRPVRPPGLKDASRSSPGRSSCIWMLSCGSKPVNGFGTRSAVGREAPRKARMIRARYAACSENLLRLMTQPASSPAPAASTASAATSPAGEK